jgi:hypothetical protein
MSGDVCKWDFLHWRWCVFGAWIPWMDGNAYDTWEFSNGSSTNKNEIEHIKKF